MFAEGQQGAKHAIALRHDHNAGVGGRAAMFVNQRAGLDLNALVVGHPHLALRHATGSEIQYKWIAAHERHANAARIGAVAPVGAAKRCDDRTRQHVDKMQRHQALRHSHLGEVADASEVVRVAQRHDAAAMGFGARHAECHGLFSDDLAVAALAVQREHGADVQQHAHSGVGAKAAFKQRVHIARQHAHAVRVVAAQIGQHQVGRDACGFFGGTAGCY